KQKLNKIKQIKMRGSNYGTVQYSQQVYTTSGPQVTEYSQVYTSGSNTQIRPQAQYQYTNIPGQAYDQSYQGIYDGEQVKRAGKQGGFQQIGSAVPLGALTDPDNAKAVAKRLFEQYDRSRKGRIDANDSLSMIQDTYKYLNTQINLNIDYSNSYQRVIDTNGDKQCTIEDIENLCMKYLCGAETKQFGGGEKVKRAGKKQYPQEIETKLNVARRLFKKYDQDAGGYLDRNEINELIKDTYKEMGMANFAPSQADVAVWLDMADLNRDNQVSQDEYEDLVIKSLVKAGFKIENANIVF
ncbi:hypothetical protein IMG5_152910, partial [Ichthyophthirius multifiliis]